MFLTEKNKMKKLIKVLTLLIVSAIFVLLSSALKQNEPFEKRASKIKLQLVKDIPLPGGAVRFDYQTIDQMQRRLYISHMGANTVTVFDLDSQKVIANISNISGPTGILAVPQIQRVYVSASAGNKVYIFNSVTLKKIGEVATLRFPDGIAFDPVNKRIFVSNEFGKAITVIDAVKNTFIKNINMGGEVGNTHYDPAAKLIYSTVQTNDEIAAINPVSLNIISKYKLQNCQGPHGFYIDDQTHYAFITGEDDASYVVFDLTSHREIAKGKVGADPDVIAFDTLLHRLYVASESGVVSVFSLGQNKIDKIAETYFAPHAHTISVDEKTHLVYFPLQNINAKPILRIMKPAN